MNCPISISIVIMASGFGKRYGTNKLLEEFRGRPLYQYVLEQAASSGAERIVLVTRFPEIEKYVNMYYPEVKVIWNQHPEHGISESIGLGLQSEWNSDGCCFMVSDQPLMKKESVQKILARFREDPMKIYVSSDGEHRGNPVIFPKEFYGELMALDGDEGGKIVIKKHPEKVVEVFVQGREELSDIDCKSDKMLLEEEKLFGIIS